MKKGIVPPGKVGTPLVVIECFYKIIKAFESYKEWQIKKEETKQLKIIYATEVKKAKAQLKALERTLDFNLKYIKEQRAESAEHRQVILKTLDGMIEVLKSFIHAYSELAMDPKSDPERLREIGNKISDCIAVINELVKGIRPNIFQLWLPWTDRQPEGSL
ncbi:MAG: hypothetical protein ABIM19_02110 [candidate division WOR-3 bacterium]